MKKKVMHIDTEQFGMSHWIEAFDDDKRVFIPAYRKDDEGKLINFSRSGTKSVILFCPLQWCFERDAVSRRREPLSAYFYMRPLHEDEKFSDDVLSDIRMNDDLEYVRIKLNNPPAGDRKR
jgi:hypothetical protein